ncbi:MAG: hypothetical protein ABIP48_11675, partial [Planctomycetota bacterium]
MKQPRINQRWRFWIALVALLGISALSSMGAIVKGGEAAALKPVALSARAFDLKQVRLLDGPFRDAMERD